MIVFGFLVCLLKLWLVKVVFCCLVCGVLIWLLLSCDFWLVCVCCGLFGDWFGVWY